MAISGDYSSPVTVNGFSCANCTDVDRAKKFIDPADPKSGPFGASKTGHGKAAHKAVFDAAALDRISGSDPTTPSTGASTAKTALGLVSAVASAYGGGPVVGALVSLIA